MAEFKAKFEKLNNANYTNWRFKMELLLKRDNLWMVISTEKPVEPVGAADVAGMVEYQNEMKEWIRKDEKAFSIIGLSIEDDQIVHIRNEKTAVGAWNELKQYHEKATLSNKVHLNRQICTTKMDEGGSVLEHINRMQDLFVNLKNISDAEVSESWSVAMLLSSLPRSYDTLITALEARKEDELTFAFVQQKLIAEFERRINGDGNYDEKALKAKFQTKRNEVSCFFCKKPNHIKKDCPDYIKWKAKKEKQSSANASKNSDKSNSDKAKVAEHRDFLFTIGKFKRGEIQKGDAIVAKYGEIQTNDAIIARYGEIQKDVIVSGGSEEVNHDYVNVVGQSKKKIGWLIDSGATRHVVNNKDFFSELDETYRGVIEVGNGNEVKVFGIGSGNVYVINQKGTVNKVMVREVLFSPEMVSNLLSIGKLTDKGFEILFRHKACEIFENDKQVAVADRTENLYELRVKDKANVSISGHKENCIHDWHQRLGHRDPEAIRKMKADGLIEDMKIVECGVIELCESCAKGKMSRVPFPKKSLSETRQPLDLIHSDVCGPMRTQTPSGKRYVVTFIDDFSRFTVIQLLSHKSEVEGCIKQFIEMVKNKFGRKPKVIRTDRGGEYTGKQLGDYLKSEGIQSQLTAGYSPQQNGIAERKNRSIIEMARCMLLNANLPHTFWGEAVTAAVYIQNRTITRATNSIPIVKWDGTKISLNHLRVFGTKCFVHIPAEKRKKLDHTSTEMIFMGYDSASKAYRCYDPITKKLTVSRDVKFDKNQFGNNQLDTEKSLENLIGVNLGSSTEGEKVTTDEEVVQENELQFEEEPEQGEEDFHTPDDHRALPNNENSIIGMRRVSQRINKGIPPRRLADEMYVAVHEVKEPRSYNEAISCKDKDKWIAAMHEEMKSLKTNNTWEITNFPDDRRAIGCKWVFKAKTNIDGTVQRYKARLVAQGFSQKFGTDYNEIFAPVVRQATFRTLLSVASQKKLMVEHLDAKTAFLNGNLEETIFMKQPPGFSDGGADRVCLLKKSIYGLKQAAKAWNDAIHGVLINAGFAQSKNDQCLYSKFIDNNWCYVLIYVDDITVACKTKEQIAAIESILSSKFEMQNLGKIKHYLGIEVTQDDAGNFELCQSSYIEQIASKFGLQDAKEAKTPMDVSYYKSSTGSSAQIINNEEYQKLMGCLLYVSVNSRPDIAASISILAQKVSNPTQDDWNQLKRAVKYLKATANLRLKLSDVAEKKTDLVGYADANWAEDRDSRKSNSGYAFFYNGGLINWSCRKQNCVSLSSTEAEFIALSDACQEAIWLQRLLKDMHQNIGLPTLMNEDNQSCLKIIKEEKFSNRTKHIDTKLHFVKDYIDKKLIECKYCPTDEMITDLFTKPLSIQKHIYLRNRCKLI